MGLLFSFDTTDKIFKGKIVVTLKFYYMKTRKSIRLVDIYITNVM